MFNYISKDTLMNEEGVKISFNQKNVFYNDPRGVLTFPIGARMKKGTPSIFVRLPKHLTFEESKEKATRSQAIEIKKNLEQAIEVFFNAKPKVLVEGTFSDLIDGIKRKVDDISVQRAISQHRKERGVIDGFYIRDMACATNGDVEVKIHGTEILEYRSKGKELLMSFSTSRIKEMFTLARVCFLTPISWESQYDKEKVPKEEIEAIKSHIKSALKVLECNFVEFSEKPRGSSKLDRYSFEGA